MIDTTAQGPTMKIPMKCIRCDARIERAIPGDPSYEVPCPDRDCTGRMTATD